MDEEQILPIWIPSVLFYHVFPNAVEYIFSVFRSAGAKTSSNAALDIQITMALGISRDIIFARCCTICFWIL